MKQLLLFLTCPNTEEATKIAHALLDSRLAVCIKFSPITAHFLWNGSTESSHEILLLIETVEEKYDAIYDAVKRLHSYETFVLQAVAVEKSSPSVHDWIRKELHIL